MGKCIGYNGNRKSQCFELCNSKAYSVDSDGSGRNNKGAENIGKKKPKFRGLNLTAGFHEPLQHNQHDQAQNDRQGDP